MTYPSFSVGEVLTAADMNAVGLWRVTTCTVTSVGGTAATASNGVITIGNGNTSVTINNAFSSSFAAYRIHFSGCVGSQGTDLNMTLGTNTVGASYFGSYYYDNVNGAITGTTRRNNGTNFPVGGLAQNNEQSFRVDIFNPQAAMRTSWNGQAFGNSYSFWYAGTQATNTQFTAITFFPDAGNMTGGTIRVYGYRD